MDEQEFVALSVLVVVGHLGFWLAESHLDVGVPVENDASCDGVAMGFGFLRFDMLEAEGVGFDILWFGGVEFFPTDDLGRGMDVVHGGRRAGEAFGAEDFFGVEGSVWSAELGVAFFGHLAHGHVIRHRKSTSFFPSWSFQAGGVIVLGWLSGRLVSSPMDWSLDYISQDGGI